MGHVAWLLDEDSYNEFVEVLPHPEELSDMALQTLAQRAGLIAVRASVDAIESLQGATPSNKEYREDLTEVVEDLQLVSSGQGVPSHEYTVDSLIRYSVVEIAEGEAQNGIAALSHIAKLSKMNIQPKNNGQFMLARVFRSVPNKGILGEVKKLFELRLAGNSEALREGAIQVLKNSR